MNKMGLIWKYEILKIIKSPMVIGIFMIFLVSDLFLVYRNYWAVEELKALNNIIDRVGNKIDDEMIENFEIFHKEELERANNIIALKEGKAYSSMEEYFKLRDSGIQRNIYNKEEKRVIEDAMVIEEYFKSIPIIRDNYEKIDFNKGMKGRISSIGATDGAKEILENNIVKFEERFNELKGNREHLELFFNGRKYRMHGFLFKEIFGALIFQIMILIGIITTFLVNYEFESGTSLMVYSTKRGRNTIYNKLKSCIVVSIGLSTMLIAIVLGSYFTIYDYSRVFTSSVSSMFNWESTIPNISWFNINILQYLILNIILVYLCVFIFVIIAFVVGRLIKNTYIAFVVCCILNGLGLIIHKLIPTSSSLLIYSTFNPFILSADFGSRFMNSYILTNFKYYEGITICLWASIMIGLVVYACKSFKRVDIL